MNGLPADAGNSWTAAKAKHAALSPHYKWFVVAMLWWISFFNYADRQAVFSVFDLLEREMGLSKTNLGLLGSSFALVYGVCAPFAGHMVDRIRRKTAILGGLQAWSIICLATAWSRNFAQLLFFRAAEGLGETFYYPGSTALISDYHGKATRSRALGIHQTSVYVGTIAGGYFAGLIGEHFGWRWPFVVFGTLGIVLGLVLYRFLHEPRRGAAEEAEEGSTHLSPPAAKHALGKVFAVLRTKPVVISLMLAFLFANFVAMVLLAWMPKFLKEQFGLGLAAAALTATIYAQVASMAGAALGGWLADYGRKRTVRGRILVQVVGVLGGAPFVFLCGQTHGVAWLIVALAGWGLFKGLYDANIFASVFDVVPAELRGSIAGLMNMVAWLGAAVAATVIGAIGDAYGLSPAIASTAAVYLGAAAFLAAALAFVGRDQARAQN